MIPRHCGPALRVCYQVPKKATTVTRSVLTADGAETKEPLEVANAFNSFFTSVGATLAKKFQDIPRTISTRSENRFKFQPVSAEAVCEQLRGLKTSKAHGVDGIPARLRKMAARELHGSAYCNYIQLFSLYRHHPD